MGNFQSGVIRLFFALMLLLMVLYTLMFALSSCSIAKKTEKAYTGVASYDPLTAKDSSNFYKRAKTLIHPPKPTIQPGHTVKVPYPVEKIKKVLDSATLQHIVDSLEIAHANDLNNTVDDCMESVKKARLEGVKEGYKQAQYEDYINGRDSITPDIYYVPDSSAILMLDNTRVDLRNAQEEVIKLRTSDQIHTGEAKSRLWVIIALATALLLSVYFNVKGLFTGTSFLNKLKNKL